MQINATDNDSIDTLTYMINDTRFTINSTSGLVNKTNSISTVGTYNTTINVTDGKDTTTMWVFWNITNTKPNVTVVNISPTSPQSNQNMNFSNMTQIPHLDKG